MHELQRLALGYLYQLYQNQLYQILVSLGLPFQDHIKILNLSHLSLSYPRDLSVYSYSPPLLELTRDLL